MIVAGFGCRPDAPAEDFALALTKALAVAGCEHASLGRLALPHFRAAMAEAMGRWGLPVGIIDQDGLEQACTRAETHSALALAHTGLASVAESAALAAAGPVSRLLARRVSAGSVTCAIAIGDDFS